MRNGFRSNNIHIIPEATNLPPVRSLSTVTKERRPTLLSLGSIRPMKRTLDQVKGFELAADRDPKLRLTIAGDATGAYGQNLLAYIAASRHAAAITYAGRPTDGQQLQLMRRSTAILATSVKEGWGLTVTEAAGQGTPAIVYDVDGLRDAVRPGATGLITTANTPEALATAITKLTADPAIYQNLQHAAWTWARHLTFDRTYKEFARILGI
jgi:glycosyltransferase involved in cell wall biosynthesis